MTAHLMIFAGTSFSVGVTEMILQFGAAVGVPIFSIDPAAETAYHPAITLLRSKSEELLPAVCEQLGIAV